MDLSLRGARGFAFNVWIRAVLIGGLSLGAIDVALHRLYATALILGTAAVVLGLDLARAADAADRMLAQFIDSLALEGADRPSTPPGFRRLAGTIERAFDRAGQALARGQQRVDFAEALADSIVAALLVVDGAGTIVHANRAALRLLGDASGPLDRLAALGPQAGQRLLSLAPGGRDIVRLADNQALLASMTIFSAPGRPLLRLIALQSLSGDLDLVVLKSWQDLVRVLAHEMLNSLTPICSLSDSVAARVRRSAATGAAPNELTVDIVQAVDVIARRSAGLMNFVERYRRLAEMPNAVRRPVLMSQFVETLDRLMTPLMREADIDYASVVEPENLSAEADSDLLEQATINLLKNALDAVAGRARPIIRLSCRLDADHVAIAVEDDGPGLACEDAETAFVPFFTTKIGGSGIGLTLSRQIALAHGGRLEHRRRVPNGAIFRLILPRGRPSSASAPLN